MMPLITWNKSNVIDYSVNFYFLYFLPPNRQTEKTANELKNLEYSLQMNNRIGDFIHIFFSEDNDPT